VRCQPDFDLQGTSIRLCQADGFWSGTPASCKGEQEAGLMHDDEIQQIPHGGGNCPKPQDIQPIMKEFMYLRSCNQSSSGVFT